MRTLKMQPEGWPLKLSECRPGHFVFHDLLCFKNDYKGESYNEGGEYLMIKDDDIVQPVTPEWEEVDGD